MARYRKLDEDYSEDSEIEDNRLMIQNILKKHFKEDTHDKSNKRNKKQYTFKGDTMATRPKGGKG